MTIRFYNTLGKKKQEFKPIKPGLVKIYNCGPTVYDQQHIGNMRSAVIWDILRRVLEFNGYKTKQVINVTDFGHLTDDADQGEDKMARGLRKEGLDFTLDNMKKLAEKYTDIYIDDRKKLNALSPSKLPFASEHITEDIKFIKELEKKEIAYITNDGVYFDTSKFPKYGKLGGLSKIQETRIGANQEKRNSRDFCLWKFNNKLGWDSPWGKGFPGWHIECSAMSRKYLGKTFDIHTGGIEHIPIHHNNEIAQSEAANNQTMAHFWLHNEHLILKDGKMAKSEGNFITLKEVEERGFDPLSLRLLFLQAHYRSHLLFSWESLNGADQSLKKLRQHVLDLSSQKKSPNKNYLEKFKKLIGDDLDTPKALALLWKLLKDKNVNEAEKKATVLEFDKVFGLKLDKKEKKVEIPAEVKKLIQERETARKNKNWQESDRLRDLIKQKGFEIRDTEKGSIIQ